MNILVVDDEPLVLERAERKLDRIVPNARRFGFTDAEAALDFAETTHIDIAFLDINMRFLDGITMARQLIEWYPRINIVFCTGYEDYALDALGLHCSSYLLKPVTEGKLRDALAHLRYPITRDVRVEFRCFGNFEVLCDDEPVVFQRGKTKELLAYLVDRKGADCSRKDAMAVIFGDTGKGSYFDNLRLDLLRSFEEAGAPEVIRQGWGILGVERDLVQCDYFDYLDGRRSGFSGEYMVQYPWAQATAEQLLER